MLFRSVLAVIIAATALTMRSSTATPATLLTADSAAQVVSLRNVITKESEITGEIVNHSKQTLREVQLQILYSWRWQNETHPGADDPGRAAYHMVGKDIPAGQSARFDYKPSPPLPVRNDGSFEISVKVVGFAQVYQ
jgi:hypothetical protein